MNKNIFCFPGYTKKAFTFTIDDGNLPLDKKFIDIVKPAGIKGTFNLVGADRQGRLTDEEYREFYRGFEIADHCKSHPKVILPTDNYVISDDAFDPQTANGDYIYKTEREGVYHKKYVSWWGCVATTDAYIKLIDDGKAELDAIFGKENVRDFVWPYHEQDDDKIKEHLRAAGYRSVRKTGTAGFDMPTDRMAWCYNAVHTNLCERAAEYEALSDDGSLKFFCFGLHSHDYENNNCWDVLQTLADKYGNRPDDFWYATVGEIFDYEDAVNAATVTDGKIKNNSDITVYMIVDGKRVALAPGEEFKV